MFGVAVEVVLDARVIPERDCHSGRVQFLQAALLFGIGVPRARQSRDVTVQEGIAQALDHVPGHRLREKRIVSVRPSPLSMASNTWDPS